MRRERIAAPLITLLLLVSVVGGAFAPAGLSSPVGVSSAQAADDPECSTWDAWIYDFMNTGHSGNEDNPCSAAHQVQDLADEWNETDAKQTRTQIHSQAGQLAAGNEQHLTVMSNSLTESDTVAFSKGEAAAVETLANGGTVSEAQQAANESIEDHYAIKQENLIDRWNVNSQTAFTLKQRANNTTGVDPDHVTAGDIRNSDFADSYDYSVSNFYSNANAEVSGINSDTITLVNGTSVRMEEVNVTVHYQRDGSAAVVETVVGVRGLEVTYETYGTSPTAIEPFTLEQSTSESSFEIRFDSVRVRPTDSLSPSTSMKFTEFRSNFKNTESKSQTTKEEVAVYVNQSLGPAVKNGSLDAQNYVSPATLAQEYSQDYNGSSGYTHATAIAASSGMSTPDLDSTASMTVTHNGSTYEGMLLSQNGPENDSWESGATYDASLISGMQFFAVAGESGSVIEMDGPFTIEAISGMDGDEIATANTTQITYEVSNQSANYTALQEQIRGLNQQIEERQAAATSGSDSGGSSGGLLEQLAALLGISAGAAMVVVVAAAALAVKIYTP